MDHKLTPEQLAELQQLDTAVSQIYQQIGAWTTHLRRAEALAIEAENLREIRVKAIAALCGLDLSKPDAGTWKIIDGAFVKL